MGQAIKLQYYTHSQITRRNSWFEIGFGDETCVQPSLGDIGAGHG